MKLLYRFMSVLLPLCLICCLPVIAFAIKYEDYTVFDVSAHEEADFFKKIGFTTSDIKINGNAFSNFAVSEQGKVALFFDSDKAAINVYDSHGEFLYGYSFVNGGAAFALFFEGEVLSMVWGKELYIASFDAEGNCLAFGGYKNTKGNADAYHQDRYPPNSGQVGNIRYDASKIRLCPNYTRFIIEDETGEKTEIYDATKEVRARCTIIWAVVISAVMAVLMIKRKNKISEAFCVK